MTAEQRLTAMATFVLHQGTRLEQQYQNACRVKLNSERELDGLDLLDLMELKHRLEFWNELDRHFEHLLFADISS